MEPINVYICIVCLISLVFLALTFKCIFKIIETYKEYKENCLALHKYEIDMKQYNEKGISDSDMIDEFINECFEEYKILHIIPDDPTMPQYIDEEGEMKIRNDLVRIVGSRMSDTFIDYLSIRYKTESIASIIANRIYLLVMNYVISVRQDHDSYMRSIPNEITFDTRE